MGNHAFEIDMTGSCDMDRELPTALAAKVIAVVTGSLSIALGLLVIFGWHTSSTLLVKVHPAFSPMPYSASFGFVVTGAGLLFVVYGRHLLGTLCGSTAVIIGLSGLVQHLFAVDPAIDHLLADNVTFHLGRMSPNTALAFLLTGGSLVTTVVPHLRVRCTITLVPIATVIFSLGVLGFVGDVAGIKTTYGLGSMNRMAIHAAAGFIAMGLGIGAFGWGRTRSQTPDMLAMRRAVIAYATVGVLLMGLFSVLVIMLPLYDQLYKAQQEHLSRLTQNKISRFEHYLSQVRSVAQNLTSDAWTRHLLQAYSDGIVSHDAYVRQTKAILEEAMRRSPLVAGMTRLDRDREHSVSVGRRIPWRSLPLPSAEDPKVRFTGPVVIDRSSYVLAIAGLVRPDGTSAGSDLLLIEWAGIHDILSEQISSARTQDVFLGIRQVDGLKAYPVTLGSGRPMVEEAEGSLASIINRALEMAPGLSDWMLNRAATRLICFGPVRDTHWALIQTIAMDEIYDAPNRPLILVLLGGTVLSLLGAVGMFFLLRPVARRMGVRTDDLEHQVRAATVRELEREKEVAEQLRRDAEELERSNIELQQFAYVASHDLREPLRMVASYLQLIQQRYQGKLDLEGNKFMGFAIEGAHRMQQLVNDLLTYSRVETRSRAFEQVDCNRILEISTENLKSSIDESGARITYDSLPTFLADGSQMMQLFQNLIGNAIKFRGTSPPRIHVWSGREDGQWNFGVRDNGIGIESEHFERIFQIFKRLQPRDKYPGTGIGLSICRRIVERHGGRIWVESELGQGSTIYFTIAEGGASREHC